MDISAVLRQSRSTELLDFLADNHMGWSAAMAPVIMGNADRPELGEELTNSFCRTDPDIAKAIRARHVQFRQPRRSCQGHDTDADPPMQRGHHRPAAGRRVRAQANAEQRTRDPEGDGPLPELQRAGRGHFGDARLCLNCGHIEEDFEDLYENAPCGYLSLRPDGRIVKANQTFCRWTGYAPDELIGKRLHDFLNIAGRIFYETHFAPLLRMQGFFNEVALDLVKKDGEAFPVLVNAAERTDAEGQPQFIRLTVFNASDRRRYERELLKARDELKALTTTLEKRVAEAVAEQLRSDTALNSQREEAELREQFIAVLGHDLRNPLASIAAGHALSRESKLDEKAEAIILLMQKSVVRMASLIDNVLDFARGRLGGGITLTLSTQPLEPDASAGGR